MSLRKQAFTGMIWTFAEMFGGQVINFFVNIILARKLFPEDYGLIGMIFIFITLSNTLMDSGIGASIMRSSKPKDEDFSTLFVSNLFFSIVIYLLLFLSAPYIAGFYNKEIFTNLIRIFGLNIIIQAFVQVQSIYLLKKLSFRKQTLMKLPSIILSSLIAIVMAYNGFGVWSLVFMYLTQNFFWALFHWIFGEWNPKISFQKDIFKMHFGYGYRMTLVELLNNVTANIYQIVIGKFYNPSLVGNYTQSLTLRQVPLSNVYGAMIKVLFPIFASIQDNKEALIRNFYRCQEVLILILFPILLFLCFNAEDVLVALFSEKWRSAAIFLQVLSVRGLFVVLVNWNLAILKIICPAKEILKYEFLFKLFLFFLIGFILILERNIYYLLISIPLYGLLNYLIYNVIISKRFNVSSLIGLRITLKYIGFSILPLILTLFLNKSLRFENVYLKLTVGSTVCFFMYGVIIFTAKRSLIKFLFDSIKLK